MAKWNLKFHNTSNLNLDNHFFSITYYKLLEKLVYQWRICKWNKIKIEQNKIQHNLKDQLANYHHIWS